MLAEGQKLDTDLCGFWAVGRVSYFLVSNAVSICN